MSHGKHYPHIEPRPRINWWVLVGRVVGFGGYVGMWIWIIATR